MGFFTIMGFLTTRFLHNMDFFAYYGLFALNTISNFELLIKKIADLADTVWTLRI